MATWLRCHSMKMLLIQLVRRSRESATLCALVLVAWFLASALTASAAVSISSFIAQAGNNQIKLMWTTASELKNRGFNLERSTDQNNWQHVGANPSVLSQSPCINNMMGASYQFIDAGLAPGLKYYYRLQLYGQPCGDQNTYYEQIVSAFVGPTPTPTFTPTATRTSTPSATAAFTATATATQSGVPSLIPSVTPGASSTANPSRTPTPIRAVTATPSVSATLPQKIAIAVPTKIAASQVQDTPVSTRQPAQVSSAPTDEPVPAVQVLLSLPDEPVELEEPSAGSENFVRVGAIGLAGLFGLASLVCVAFALYLSIRPRHRS